MRVVRAKSRLVARGVKERDSIDFGKTFAPTVSSSLVRVMSAIARELGFDLGHFGVDQVFVESTLNENGFCACRRDVVVFSVKLCG